MSLKTEQAAEDWQMRNDARFLQALTKEIKHLEVMLTQELMEFRAVHIDIEPW